MSSHRSRTKRKTLTWQGAGVLLAAGAVGLFILPIANWIRPAQANWDNGAVRPVALPGGVDSLAMSLAEAQSMADILNGLAPPKPVIEEPPKPEPADGGEEVQGGAGSEQLTPPPPPPRINWIYLGSAVTPRASRALVRIDQSQKFVRQGAEVDGVKLLEVHDDHIVVEEHGMQKRIERAAMVASAMLAPPKGGAGAAAANKAGAPTPPVPTPPPGSAAAALAAAQAAHGKTGKGAAPNVPGRAVARIMQLSPEMRAQAFTAMTSPTATYEDKIRAISELGFDPESNLAERQEAMRAIGVNPEDPDVLRILEDELNGAARKER